MADGWINQQELCDNPDLSIRLAAAYIADREKNTDPNATEPGLSLTSQLAAYNGGDRAVGPSADCGDKVPRYQCCTNPGGYAETQDYVNTAMGVYNAYNQ